MDEDVPRELAGGLRDRLGTVLGGPVEISDLHQLSGGASRETWAFGAQHRQDAPRRLVLRRDPPGCGRPESMALEAAVIAAAQESEVPVPALVDHSTDESILGSPYLITAQVDGETIPRRLLREPEFEPARATLARELGGVLARIHSIPPSSVPGLLDHDPLEELVATYDALEEPLPSVELALHWLRANRPERAGTTVVHGDFRNGNLIVDPTGLRAVLDWELVHLGDPLQDLGWLCVKAWRFGSPHPVGGFGSREDLFAGYAEVAGAKPDPEAVHWWEVFGTAKWAVGCRAQAQRHLSGETRSVELAAIGRRVCEQEHDLLLALGVPPPEADGAAVPEHPTSDLHGHPSAAELVAAVGEFLRTEVLPAHEGRFHFHTRVAANVLATVERELTLGEQQQNTHQQRLAELGFTDQAGLAAAIRAETVDPDDPAVIAAVRAAVTDRLTVANPRYLSDPA
ncbi:aminoglycoside phosphotransferase (APT) family kinase protein [Halopolyspora algeriensis]|uniref:Aminoglycoside phosphotransferase (APT) family kinase protein n=1 Tax=Halopolyspora algeriensis TaxID=1500506 RepID=A0A368VI92_9ACTN|nr:phosphotransferase family protein [Halopolyspora algeriensis]RCW41005.1 aminoglycoside phosphotransferase (APT) family kinase protein [Halopolyspora algeriensis]TQM53911.1 aminoglycoside phosphotransferase (APT) family kinase protein [Halopolyspora algeriensis]